MADPRGDVKEWVEGYTRDGKELNKITTAENLQEIQKDIKRGEVELNKNLAKVQMQILEVQNDLDAANQEYNKLFDVINAADIGSKVNLDQDQTVLIDRITQETIGSFLDKRDMTEEDRLEVDVQFLPFLENLGAGVPSLASAGAGSRDAKFTVQLCQEVRSLQEQAAKYWGLNQDKVFFLDRDHRIVPDNMKLREVILPPTMKSKAEDDDESSWGVDGDSSQAIVNTGRGAASSSTALVSAEGGGTGGKKLHFCAVKQKNYSFILVKAGTVLMKEDMNQPKGERWNDFTFNEASLQEELNAARRAHGGQDDKDQDPALEDIPKLDELINKAKEEKKKKRWDTRCRFAEVFLFIICLIVYYILMMNWDHRMVAMNTVIDGVRRDLSTFTVEEQAKYGVSTFSNVSGADAFQGWLDGPLRRTVLPPNLLNPKKPLCPSCSRLRVRGPEEQPGVGHVRFLHRA
jgi:hypothetical protein